MLKVNNKNTKTTLLSIVSIVDFEQVDVRWKDVPNENHSVETSFLSTSGMFLFLVTRHKDYHH